MNHSYETTCTDCTKTIEVASPDGDISALGLCARLCGPCRSDRVTNDRSITPLSPQGGLGNYRMEVELQWPITEEDLVYLAPGDMEEDFARRSMHSIRSALQLVAGSGADITPIANYHLHIGTLRRCVGEPVSRRADGCIRQYHEALNQFAVLMFDLEEVMAAIGGNTKVNFSNVFSALAIGRRQGWPVDSKLDDQVRRSEDDSIPLSESEAAKRVGEWTQEKERE